MLRTDYPLRVSCSVKTVRVCDTGGFEKNVTVDLRYCESNNNYLIQASDILANRIWASYATGNKELRNIGNHVRLTLP